MINYAKIKQSAAEAGFTLCGVSRYRVLSEHSAFFASSLAASGEGALRYLADRPERRLDSARLFPGVRTVVMCAVNYRNSHSEGYPEDFPNPKICSYALSTRYQPKIGAMLEKMLGRLAEEFPGLSGRAFCDTSAILEKAWAVESGLGWIGRNSLLVNPVWGSFLLLGGLLLDHDCDAFDLPSEEPGCGDCRRCMDTCPAGAIPRPRVVDTGRCISALTIEKSRAAHPGSLHGWIFGCDVCQSVCPFNRGRPRFSNPSFGPLVDSSALSADDWRSMDEDRFSALFGGTPLTRTGLERIKKMLPEEK